MPVLKLATLNLYQFAEPGTFWYERDERNDHEPDRWAAKRAWIAAMLAEADADVVAVQEVFAPDSLRELAEAAGYPHAALVAEPARDPDDPDVLVGPVVGLLSRHPLLGSPEPLGIPTALLDAAPLSPDFTFRRDVVRARIDLPGLGPTTVMAAHLKSQGAFIDDDAVAALPEWPDRFRKHLQQRAVRDAEQLVRRSSEAAALYLSAMEEVEADRNAPIVVLGDLNDNPASPTLRIATQSEWIINIAGRRYSGIETPSDRAWGYTWRLYDTYDLVPGQFGLRPNTHAGGWRYGPSVLDYALVSNGLNPRNPGRVGTVVDHRVFADHLEDGADLATSDHALVRITIEA